MSRQTNNQNGDNSNEPLKDLLKRQQPEDDFEQEAMEGFALLENEQEAIDLKAELDAEISFGPLAEQKATPRIYWMAAAALLLVVGISAFFLLANDPAAKPELALTVPSPSPADSVMVAPEQPYEVKAAELSSVPSKNAQTAVKEEAAKPERNAAGPPPPLEVGVIASAAAQPAAEPVAIPAEKGNAAADLAFNDADSKQSPKKEEKARFEESEKDQLADEEAETDKVKADDARIAANSAAKKKAKPAAAQLAKKFKSSRARSEAPAGAGAPDRSSANGLSNAMADSTGNCYYMGGDKELHKQLTQRLKEKGLDRHFAATLFISANTRVMKVEFTRAEGISPEEQSEIRDVIQSLDQFRFHSRPAKEALAEYKIAR